MITLPDEKGARQTKKTKIKIICPFGGLSGSVSNKKTRARKKDDARRVRSVYALCARGPTQTELMGSSTGHGASVTWVEAPW